MYDCLYERVCERKRERERERGIERESMFVETPLTFQFLAK